VANGSFQTAIASGVVAQSMKSPFAGSHLTPWSTIAIALPAAGSVTAPTSPMPKPAATRAPKLNRAKVRAVGRRRTASATNGSSAGIAGTRKRGPQPTPPCHAHQVA
jgi:hypothetical protein